jgi:hypothetical protein
MLRCHYISTTESGFDDQGQELTPPANCLSIGSKLSSQQRLGVSPRTKLEDRQRVVGLKLQYGPTDRFPHLDQRLCGCTSPRIVTSPSQELNI